MNEAPSRCDFGHARPFLRVEQLLADPVKSLIAYIPHRRHPAAVAKMLKQRSAGHARRCSDISDGQRFLEVGMNVVDRTLHIARGNRSGETLYSLAVGMRMVEQQFVDDELLERRGCDRTSHYGIGALKIVSRGSDMAGKPRAETLA